MSDRGMMLDRLRSVAYHGGRVLLYGVSVLFLVHVAAGVITAGIVPLMMMATLVLSVLVVFAGLAWIAHRLIDWIEGNGQ